MDKKNILLALDYQMSETRICQALDISHLEFRQFLINNSIEYDFSQCPESLQKEVKTVYNHEEWNRPKLQKRYRLTATQILQCIYDNGPKDKPSFSELLLQDYIEAGMTTKEIADTLDISVYRTRNLLRQYGLKPLSKSAKVTELVQQMLLDKKSIEQICKEVNLSPKIVYKIKSDFIGVKEYAKRGTASTKKVKKLHNQGLSQQQIANELGVSQATISRKLAK